MVIILPKDLKVRVWYGQVIGWFEIKEHVNRKDDARQTAYATLDLSLTFYKRLMTH